jgi:hypothetical protein
MKTSLVGLFLGGLALTSLAADPPATPSVTIALGGRQGHVMPVRQGFTHTGAGNVDVVQPAADVVVFTMTGVAVAGGHPCRDSVATMNFDLEQCFEVIFEKPEIKRAKLTLEGRVIGLLRSHRKGGGSAQEGPGQATIKCGPAAIIGLTLPPHAVCGGENLSLNDRCGPNAVPVVAGLYSVQQSWSVSATHPKSILPCKAASAEFAPDPALDPLWISYWEPFHGAAKKDLGFQVILKVAAENGPKVETAKR